VEGRGSAELTIHLHQEFRLNPPAGLMFTVTATPTSNGVYFINKYGAGCIVASLRGGGGAHKNVVT
jgi:hypothetical protein